MVTDKIQPDDWIRLGNRDAVVCNVYENRPGFIEVVYLDRERAINEDAHWIDDHWEFVHQGSSGGYADKYDRLSRFVSILRAGRYH